MGRIVAAAGLLVALIATGGEPVIAQSSPPDVIDDVSVVIVQLQDPEGGTLTPDQLEAARAVVEGRLEALPAMGAIVTLIPDDRIRIDLADPSQLEAVTRVATAPGVFRIMGIPLEGAGDVMEGEPLPEGMTVHEVVAPGHVAHAEVGLDDVMGEPVIDLQLDAEAADGFDAWAADHFGEPIALILDDVVISAATLQATRFDGRIQLSGSFDPSWVEELAATLSGGPLPVLAEPLPLCLPAACPVPGVSPGASNAP